MKPRFAVAIGSALLLMAWACRGTPTNEPDPDLVATSVAETLTSLPPTATAIPALDPSATASPAEPTLSATPTTSATPTPPVDGISLNCDGTYQRVRGVDLGPSGRALALDQWNGSGWSEAWSFEAGDPMIRQMQPEAGAYAFGGCRRLLMVPLIYTGSGAVLELHVFGWTGTEAIELFQGDGIHGTWRIEGDKIIIEESLYLFDEPICCPCNRQVESHRWNGTAFVESSSEIHPTYTGTPPPMCTQ